MSADANSSQCAAILAWLQKGHKLTPAEALERFGCMRLGARVYELRAAGNHISRDLVPVGISPSGRITYVARYSLHQ